MPAVNDAIIEQVVLKPDWFLYLIRTKQGNLYTGITTDVERRFKEHCSGGKKSAKYLKGKGPLLLVYCIKVGARANALKLEYQVKRLNKQTKENIITGSCNLITVFPALFSGSQAQKLA